MRLSKRIELLVALLALMLSPVAQGLDEESKYVPKEGIEHAIVAMSEECSARATMAMCQCMNETMTAEAEARGYRLTRNQLLGVAEHAWEECSDRSGLLQEMKKRAYVACFTGRPLQNVFEAEDLATLQARYPGKVEACQCYQANIDALDDEAYKEVAALSYQTLKLRTACARTASKEECRERHPKPERLRMLTENCRK